MTTDTSLAEKYLKECNHEFHTLGSTEKCDSDKFALDSANNKIFYTNKNTYEGPPIVPESQITDFQTSIRELAKKLEENVELFAQLECLIRKVPIEEVTNYDMKLLIQHLWYCSTLNIDEIEMELVCVVEMTDNSPLCCLGSIVHVPKAVLYNLMIIEASVQTAAVCSLFTQLCHQVGLNKVTMMFKEPSSPSSLIGINVENIEVVQNGGVGVVTERSELVTAVDKILDSPLRCPWRLRKILVQENVYESFQDLLELMGDKEHDSIEQSLKSLSARAVVYKNKIFLIDYVGTLKDLEDNSKQVILVEAYRTTKELLSLVKKQNPYCLSLWSNDYSEANEIAFGVSVPVVWINNFGTFDGPEKASQTFFSVIEQKRLYHFINKNDIEKFAKTEQAWSKMSYRKRVEIFQKAIKGFREENDDQTKFANELERQILLWKPKNKEIEVNNDRMCVVIDEPVGAMAVGKNFMLSIKSVLQGTPVLCAELSIRYQNELIQFFEKEKLPIYLLDGQHYVSSSRSTNSIACTMGMFGKTRAVWSNFTSAD